MKNATLIFKVPELEPNIIKQAETIVSALRGTFDYYTGLVKQIEEKSRNNVTFAIGVVGIGALIAKTEDLVKRVVVAKGVDWVWIGVAVISLLASIGMLLRVHYLHMKVVEPQEFEAPDPEKIITAGAPKMLLETLTELTSSYKASGASISSVVTKKLDPLNKQPAWIFGIIVGIAIYLVFSGITIALIPLPSSK